MLENRTDHSFPFACVNDRQIVHTLCPSTISDCSSCDVISDIVKQNCEFCAFLGHCFCIIQCGTPTEDAAGIKSQLSLTPSTENIAQEAHIILNIRYNYLGWRTFIVYISVLHRRRQNIVNGVEWKRNWVILSGARQLLLLLFIFLSECKCSLQDYSENTPSWA